MSQNHSIFQNSKANIHDEEGSGWPTVVRDGFVQTTDAEVCEIETNSNFSITHCFTILGYHFVSSKVYTVNSQNSALQLQLPNRSLIQQIKACKHLNVCKLY